MNRSQGDPGGCDAGGWPGGELEHQFMLTASLNLALILLLGYLG